MEHVAIMKKAWGFVEKILSGEKKIESRWYQMRRAPWDKIKKGETVYFKNSGEPVKIKAEVSKVIQFADLTPKRVKEILFEFGKDIGIEEKEIGNFCEEFKNKKYCILIFLKKPVKIKPFDINKKGFGMMSAWIATNDVSKIKILEKNQLVDVEADLIWDRIASKRETKTAKYISHKKAWL